MNNHPDIGIDMNLQFGINICMVALVEQQVILLKPKCNLNATVVVLHENDFTPPHKLNASNLAVSKRQIRVTDVYFYTKMTLLHPTPTET